MCCLTFNGCAPVSIPLKGNYGAVYTINSERDFDKVWSSIIDIFAQNGISIGVIDKSSGLITSGQTSLLSSYTFEDDNGNLKNNNAWIVVQKLNLAGQEIRPTILLCSWNVRIKKTDNNKTLINVNLTLDNVQGQGRNGYGQSMGQYYPMEAKSTRVFEKIIAEQIK